MPKTPSPKTPRSQTILSRNKFLLEIQELIKRLASGNLSSAQKLNVIRRIKNLQNRWNGPSAPRKPNKKDSPKKPTKGKRLKFNNK